MTNERAIELLNRISDSQFDGPHGDERREALEMAVRALFSQQTVNDSQGLVNDCISRKAVMKEFADFVRESNNSDFAPTPTWNDAVSLVGSIPSVQPQACDDAISRDDAIMAVKTGALSAATIFGRTDEGATAYYETVKAIKALPSAQPETHDKRTETHACDLIDRQDAIDACCFGITHARAINVETGAVVDLFEASNKELHKAIERIEALPSAQPERTCVNCGRTANNGGWYADGKTRCPIEEHYALPKDGYCHLWEKRNFTDDDYPERRTDE